MRRIINVTLCLIPMVLAGIGLAQVDKAATPFTATAKPGFQLRVDSVGSHKKVEDSAADDKQTLEVRTARLGLTGDLGEGVSYTLRLDMRNAFYGSDSVGQDRSIAALDRAYLEHKICEEATVRFGRMPFMAGSIEADYSSIDLYFVSYLYDTMGAGLLKINAGVDLTTTIGTNSFVVQAANGVQEGTTAENKGTQKGENMNFALGYRGKFANGTVKPIISYNRFSRIRAGAEPSRDDKVNYTAYGVGSQFTFGQADLDLEIDALNKPAFTSYTADAVKGTVKTNTNLETKYSSIVSQLAYRATEQRLRPFVKVTSDVVKADGETTFKSARQGLGVEFRPGAKGFRYHAVAYQIVDEDVGAKATIKTTTQQFVLGAAAKI